MFRPMRGRQISLACVKNVERRLFRPKICPNIRDEGTQTILAPRPRATGVKSVIKYSSPAISSWYILGKSFHTMVDFWGCYWRQCSDFVTNSCGVLGLRLWKIISPSPEPSSPNSKKQRIQNWKCLGLYVTRQLIWRQSPKLCITVIQYTEIKM